LRYFAGRQVWLAEPDLPVPRIRPYREAEPKLMHFIALGAPGIDVLRSPELIEQKVRSQASGLHACDEWNSYFTEVTNVEAPDAGQGCYVGGNRSEPVSFNDWFLWLKRQR
jgi:hypothetical protein